MEVWVVNIRYESGIEGVYSTPELVAASIAGPNEYRFEYYITKHTIDKKGNSNA